jgi:hypothetical protein
LLQVILPTGTVVKIQLEQSHSEFLNLWITASSADFNNTEGGVHVVKLGWIGLERKKQQTKVCCFTDW